MGEDAILEVINLSKTLGKATIIDDVSFQLKRGEIKGLLGPNGSGKTTMLKLIVGLLKPTKGRVSIGGYDIQADYEKAIGKLGAVVENPELYEYLSGYDNLQQYRRMTPGVSEARLEEVVELLGMSDYIDDKVATYSLGMLQRLGLAQALLHQPDILLLDEPTNGLDPSGIQDLRKHLKLLSNQGIAILISSHILAEIEMICDSILMIDQGEIIAQGEIDQFREDEHQNSLYTFRLLEPGSLHAVLATYPLKEHVVEVGSDFFRSA
ncbi:ABC transporter ATP-binding protein [Anaerobacillus sp. CMMVII]|uniref:ABC transporter ATP-binding protein n=1 Tax=Anaerobacillus sp. CMMVII TaxID=2755588 RepID=UPI0021B83573|nr:ABC transporter ATP-binding protein [Anaerobacillus sp. CMMVII]MCT8139263.1 ABC transporter ATP-binding protein [Anaerobacillus sp. CMMVII]